MKSNPADSVGTVTASAVVSRTPSCRRRLLTASGTCKLSPRGTLSMVTDTRPFQYSLRIPGASTSSSLPLFDTRPTSSTPISASTKLSPSSAPRRSINASPSLPMKSGRVMSKLRTSRTPKTSWSQYALETTVLIEQAALTVTDRDPLDAEHGLILLAVVHGEFHLPHSRRSATQVLRDGVHRGKSLQLPVHFPSSSAAIADAS